MKKLLGITFLAGLLAFVVFGVASVNAAPTQTCEAFGVGSIPALSSMSFTFDCESEAPVYFGVCDSGSVPNDDLFNIVFNDSVVAFNSYNGGRENAVIGSGMASAGTNMATLNSLNSTPFPPATYSFAVSPNQGAVASYLSSVCGADYGGISSLGICDIAVPLFTTDKAPSAGTLTMNVQFGEFARQEGITVRSWTVVEGQQINNDTGIVPAPQYVRVWWQPEGSSEWYLLPSQYWQGDGTTASEYGIDCGASGAPSYHTSFADGIPESEVPTFNN